MPPFDFALLLFIRLIDSLEMYSIFVLHRTDPRFAPISTEPEKLFIYFLYFCCLFPHFDVVFIRST